MSKIYAVISVVAVIALLSCLGGSQPAGENQTTPGGGGGGNAGAKTVEVNIQNNAYSQTSIALNAGDSVKWTNLDDRAHQVQILSVTSSPMLVKSDTWTYTFDTAGTYTFRDADLPFMVGRVTVS